MTILRAHPAADLFPMLPDDELQALADDVRRSGLRQPIVTMEVDGERLVLDGRNRYRACAMSSVEPTFIAFDGDDPFALVVSANLHRRHMSTSQRAMVANEIATLKRTDTLKRGSARPDSSKELSASQQQAADLLKVSHSNVRRARKVKEQGIPELAAAVVAGKVSVTAAADVAGLPKEEQRQLLATGTDAVVERATSTRKPRELETPVRRIFDHNGASAKEVQSGVVLVKKPDADKPLDPRRHHDKHDLVRSLTERGYTASDIAEQTGLKKTFIHNARAQIKGRRGILTGPTEDAEVFAESWDRRASNVDPRWLAAPKEDRESLLTALSACRTAVQRMIQRLKKEARGETYEACEVEAE